jgi:hypothetical protein
MSKKLAAYNNYVRLGVTYGMTMKKAGQQAITANSLARKLDYWDEKKGDPSELAVLKMDLQTAVLAVKALKEKAAKMIPKIRKAHSALTGRKKVPLKDGQHIFKIPYCYYLGDHVNAPIYETTPKRQASFTRHIKNGRGTAILFGDLLPLMEY